MAFSEQILEEIQSKSDIAEVIGSYIPLKRAGRNFKANCPFHKEKTPSFMVSPSKQIFHCFGCGAGGNIFHFVMKFEGIEFPDAVRALAEKAGVELPRFTRSEFEQSAYAVQIYKINEFAASYYHDTLLKTEAGKRAAEYLEKRGVSEETITQAKLGFAADAWDGFINFAKSKGFETALLERSGLVITREEGGHYDRFRNKIIFPIFDIKSRVVAFGARVLDDSLPKYINSPETEVYVKSRHLYGLNFSLQAVKEKDFCVIVEGYLDFLIPYQNGIKNIAASLGTSLTESQARLIKRYTRNAVILYDGDSAGEAASLRGLDLFVQEGVNVKVAVLPKGYDPDSFVRSGGTAAFNSLIDSAADLFEYKLGILTSRYDARNAAAKSRVCAEMLPTIARVNNAVLKFEYIKRLAERLQVREEDLLTELKKVKSDYAYEPSADAVAATDVCPGTKADKILIGLMLDDAELIAEVQKHLKAEDFADEKTRKVICEIFKAYAAGKALSAAGLINCLEGDDLCRIVSEAASLTEIITDKQKNLIDCIKNIKEQNNKNKLTELRNLINVAQVMGDGKKVEQLLAELSGLLRSSKEFARR